MMQISAALTLCLDRDPAVIFAIVESSCAEALRGGHGGKEARMINIKTHPVLIRDKCIGSQVRYCQVWKLGSDVLELGLEIRLGEGGLVSFRLGKKVSGPWNEVRRLGLG
jgi:hypothetical protein